MLTYANAQTLEIEAVEPVRSWRVRYRAAGIDGNTFDAVCSIEHLDDTTVYACGALARIPGAVTELIKQARPIFREMGYTHYQYDHNKKPIRRRL